jgi:hypothetical protein
MAAQAASLISHFLHAAHEKGKTLTNRLDRLLWSTALWFSPTRVEKQGRADRSAACEV